MARKIGPAVRRSRPSLKYLKPGALAPLRDNRVVAAFSRSNRSHPDPFPPFLLEIDISSAVNQDESIPVVGAAGGYSLVSFEASARGGGEGPRCLTKKKLVAERRVRLVKSPIAVVEGTAVP